MFELGSKKTPLELVFEQKYGKIIDYRLFGDGYIVVGFSEGNVAHISTHMKEMSTFPILSFPIILFYDTIKQIVFYIMLKC